MRSKFTEQICSASAIFDFVGAHFACERDPFSRSNPDGFVNFGSAQNSLNTAEIERLLAGTPWRSEEQKYQPFAGTGSCRVAVADYLEALSGRQSVDSQRIDPRHVIIGNGVISLLEALAIALLDEDDEVLVPTPVFPGIVTALSLRTRARVSFLHTRSENQFRLTAADLEQALAEHSEAGRRPKAIVLCSPGNPVGQVFDASELSSFVRIADEYDCALIVDEVYAGSCFEGSDFHSALASGSERVFVLGGLSKDFGLAGYAAGWLHGKSSDVMRAVAKQSHFFRLPAPVQFAMERLLEPAWRDCFLQQNRERLSRRFETTRAMLQMLGVSVTPADAGLCLWLDLRPYLKDLNSEGEMELYRYLLYEHRVHLSPGAGFYCPETGFFRICFSQDGLTLREGLERIERGLNARPQNSSCHRSMEVSAPCPLPSVS